MRQGLAVYGRLGLICGVGMSRVPIGFCLAQAMFLRIVRG